MNMPSLVLLWLGAFAASLSGPAPRPPVTNSIELRAAIVSAQPGDTITMADGVWTNVAILFDSQGAEGDSIRLEAETPGGVVLDGFSTLRIAGDYLVVDGLRFEGGALSNGHVIQFRNGSRSANHSRLTNSTVVDVNPDAKQTEYKWISLYGTHNRVDHNYIRGKTNVGSTLVVWLESAATHEPTYHRIDHNHFGPRPPLGQNEGETIRIGTSTTSMQDAFVTVENNLFERCDGETEIISNKSGQNVFRGNTFLRSRGSLTLRHGNGALVEGNVFLGQNVDDTGGVRVIGEDHVIVNNYFDLLRGTGFESAIAIMNGVPDSPLNRYFQVRNVTIAHNTIVRARQAVTLGAGADSERTLPPDGVRFVNNVILSTGRSIVRQDAAPVDMTWDGTVYWGGDLGIGEPTGVLSVDPLLEPDADGVWRPLDASPLIDAAAAVENLDLAIDFDGQPRDAQPDIGADERSAAPVTRRALAPGDVGPSWPGATSGEATVEEAGLSIGTPFPHPARARTTVTLVTPAAGPVTVTLYDSLGRRVATVLDGVVPPGTRPLVLDTDALAPGLYQIVARGQGTLARTSLVIVSR